MFATGRILATPKAGLPEAALSRILRENGGVRGERIGKSPAFVVDVARGTEQQAVEQLSRHPLIKFAELDRLVPPAGTSDPYFGSAWHLPRIGAETAWQAATGQGVTIAVLDTGVNGAHPDLAGRLVPGYNFYDNNNNTSDIHGHGTAVAGTAAAATSNGLGVASVAGGALIMPIRISDSTGWASWSTVAQGVTWAADRGARVANISYVGVAASATVRAAADYMRSKGGLVIAAAGNNNRDEGIAPTASIITASATDQNDNKASFSSWGNFVNVSAPGVSIWTTVRSGGYEPWNGTSLATPVVAGTVALMMSRNPGLSGARIEELLYSTALDLGAAGRDPVFGHGRVDAARAVAAAGDTSATLTDTIAPEVAIGSPSANSTVMGIVAVNVSASDNVGVTRVDVLVNGTLLATDTTSPFTFSWDTSQVANGMNQVAAVAYDAAGNKRTSPSVDVNVANASLVDTVAPVVSIVNPVANSVVSGNVRISVSATDNNGVSALSQQLFIDGKRVATATGGVLSFTWNTRKVASGDHSIEAVVTDAAGNVGRRSVQVRR